MAKKNAATQVDTEDAGNTGATIAEWIEPGPGEPVPMPQQGGAYVRRSDGTLVLEHRTQPADDAQEA